MGNINTFAFLLLSLTSKTYKRVLQGSKYSYSIFSQSNGLPHQIPLVPFGQKYSIVYLSAFIGVFLEEKSNDGWEYVRESYYSIQKDFLSNELSLDNYDFKINELHFKRKNRVLSLMSKFTFTILSIISILIFWGLNDFNIYVTDNCIFNYAIIITEFLIIVLQVYIAVKYRDMTNLKNKLLNSDIMYIFHSKS